ncbi:MAG: hypothetical protein HY001_03300 [Candidatus Portnoybacteria bacterium]|nr:hypothetical protein [Candidatus Portnoybacteria bacterium]
MNRNALHERAKLLRAQGKTYREIQSLLDMTIPKGTLSGWLKDVVLPKDYPEKVKQLVNNNLQRGRIKAKQILELKRKTLLKNLREKNNHLIKLALNKDVAKIALAMLYLGEGAKWKGHRGLMLGSSDPAIVLLYIKLLNKCYGIDQKILKCRICYRADQKIKALEQYWSEITGVPKRNFYKTKPDPRTVGKKTLKTAYKGVCVITCRGTDIQLELAQIVSILLQGLEGP